jgi:peptide deformylase
MTQIVDRDDPVLRKTAKEVPTDEILSPKFQKIILDMKIALKSQDDGVAIAAPQIGASWRIFVVSARAQRLSKKKNGEDTAVELEDLVFINPVILRLSKKKKKMEEGCLSVRWLYGQVERCEKVQLKAYDEKGELIERGSSGLLAQIFQHEIDHLDGVLFIDKAENLEEIPPEDLANNE